MSESAPRIAVIGIASWDRLVGVERYPGVGEHVSVTAESSAPGGTSANTAVALARLGAVVTIATVVGDDADGQAIRRSLEAENVDTRWIGVRRGQRSDGATVVVSREPPDRTIYWHHGAQLARGDRLDIAGLFDHDAVVLDVVDVPLRRFLLDLPAHTSPRARLIGLLTYLADPAIHDGFDLALRHDVVVGSERDALAVTGTWSVSDATAAFQSRMVGANLRAAVITRGETGCRVVTLSDSWQLPAFAASVVDPAGAGDAFAAGVAWGVALRWDWPHIGRFANALGALAIQGFGAQTSLPSRAEVEALLRDDAADGESATNNVGSSAAIERGRESAERGTWH